MALADFAIPFGMREIELTPYTTQGATALGTMVKLPAAQKMTWGDSESFQKLRGNDQVIASRGSGAEVSWTLEGGGISLDCLAVLGGGTVTTTGTTPSAVKSLRKTVLSQRPYFMAQGRAISDNGGDLVMSLYRCQTTGSIDGELADGGFALTSCSGEAFGALAAVGTPESVIGDIYDIGHRETAAVLTA
jgi:hypothetical protein